LNWSGESRYDAGASGIEVAKEMGGALIDEVEAQGGINEAHDFGFGGFGIGADGFRSGLG
jgi:hypothetical protein